jgi:predicted PurR-regulated permease PerM
MSQRAFSDQPERRKSQLPGAAWGLGTVVLLAAFVWLILQVQAVLIALLGSVLLSALLEPAAARLALLPLGRWKVGRRLASGLVIVAFLAALGVIVWLLAPVLASQAKVLLSNLPAYLAKATTEYKAITRGLTILPDEMTTAFQGELAGLLAQLGRAAAQTALGFVSNLIGMLGLVVIPIGAFYVMSDGGSIQDDFLNALPPDWRGGTRSLLEDSSRALSSYVRGQTLVCTSASVLYSIVFGVLGLPYFAVLGVMAGVAEAIPYLGSVLVTLSVLVIGLGQGMPLAVRGLAGYLIGNQIVNYVVTPRLQSRSLQLHPFLVILAALTGASLGGPFGAFLALPAAAVLQTVLRRMWGPQARPDEGALAPPRSS